MAIAQPPEHAHDGHRTAPVSSSAPGTPQQPGEAAFGAIQEIVALLEADPRTDWSKVNIEALRRHLIDMNNVTLRADVKVVESGNAITFRVAGEGDARSSVQRMIAAHAATMNGEQGWRFSAEMTAWGADLNVSPPDAASLEKLRALGFIGIMTWGMHHQQHHLMIAQGHSAHH
jgi:hypothetical protein